ncbi:MBL fold metallo-hydrolase [Acidithiobacillus sp. CV18-2]|uniref:MBL fold metallo-hydrolase n=1 Tax=Igneacidithiobacillus copahuensis TaxID=2724909 RepID=A0AAE2YRG3_9PROT|nr:MBL fold metallo-hydrolase [Igneacidithiobacillus copahuensis]MBU2753341.1 MBL fold metallo-hydrolase [Acidithiobacillus sp. CV18-3]MBU2756371.1 MBL fold metallo-hydrolase [Acidithiobacillus sp. BN09-2]MBU2776158.1 MBL fold metallo-hydrolase [Acidithiobacillus sp. CV18-2]MBU2795771.1 MBL fold metallo-hydrolase [Acidithiobacillus sp. VAN18-2]MBU2798765.1 MBL fold metallo-hydrolase [Acidithiobacillus sp. VAN18-4]UTV81664.1 MBL fold metallo-hydrolase [Acidithiobacillus sp. YTS05]
MRIRFLGTGSSAGTPQIGCDCAVCRSADRRNQRSRASILVEEQDTRILIDTGPDLRMQMLRADVRHLDAVFYTHFHADHINGIDDLRAFNFLDKRVISCFADARTARELEERFRYCFLPPDPGWAKPSLSMTGITAKQQVGTITVLPVPVLHGNLPIYGYRFGGAAYLTDLKTIPEESYALLQDLDLLILDCLREEEHPTHVNLAESLALAVRIGARQTLLTHMTHDLDYQKLCSVLPENIAPAYDGLEWRI